MPTRKNYLLPDELLERIETYRGDARLKTEVEAVRQLIDAGLKWAAGHAVPDEVLQARRGERFKPENWLP